MEERRYTPGTWLDLATAGIRFGPDRAAVRRELAAHLEDKRADLRRRYPDLSEQEADELAAAQMGDPGELGKELARVHKPWLGYLWRVSQGLVALGMIGILLIGLRIAVRTPWDMVLGGPEEPLQGIPFACEEPVRINHYTLWVEDAAWEESGSLWLVWRATSPFFWEEPQGGMSWMWTAVDDRGNVYASQWRDRFWLEEEPERSVSEVWFQSALPGWTGKQVIYHVPRDVRWVQINLETGSGEPVRLILEREEEGP